MKVALVLGARPQIIKSALLIHLANRRRDIQLDVIHTGQHYDYFMSAVFFDELGIPKPDYNLGVGSASHGRQTGEMLIRIEEVLLKERPDWVLVYGDTNSSSILSAFNALDGVIVFPAHPRTSEAIERLGYPLRSHVRLIEPVSYLDMLILEKHARLILTDSGGVQKEAYFFAVPCLTLRKETEWVETVEAGWNVLVGADEERIVEAVRGFQLAGKRAAIFGNGRASETIARLLSCHRVGEQVFSPPRARKKRALQPAVLKSE